MRNLFAATHFRLRLQAAALQLRLYSILIPVVPRITDTGDVELVVGLTVDMRRQQGVAERQIALFAGVAVPARTPAARVWTSWRRSPCRVQSHGTP